MTTLHHAKDVSTELATLYQAGGDMRTGLAGWWVGVSNTASGCERLWQHCVRLKGVGRGRGRRRERSSAKV